jgi:hypothetical protein
MASAGTPFFGGMTLSDRSHFGATDSVVTIPRPAIFGLALSPDERLILYGRRDEVGSDLMLVESFR